MVGTFRSRALVIAALFAFSFQLNYSQQKQKACFSPAARAEAERSARLWAQPDSGYDPVLGYDPSDGPRTGAPPVERSGFGKAITCRANKDLSPGSGTTPKFHCSVDGVTDEDGEMVRYKVKPHFKGQARDKRNGEIYGEFLSSRFSKAVGFFADDNWVADVTCPDCEKSLTSKFQGAPWNPFQPAAGIELSLGKGIDANCDDKDTTSISKALDKMMLADRSLAEIDAFKLWLAFIDHGDTKTDNQKYSCLKTVTRPDGSLACKEGQAVFYPSDMGSTFGHATSSEKKARLARWKEVVPIKVNSKGQCTTTAKDAGDPLISEEGRALLADQLQRLIDAEKARGTITGVFRASRNAERDEAPEAWTAEFIRKANQIINARCSM